MIFFEREKIEIRYLAVEKLSFLYTLFTTLLIILFYNRISNPQAMLTGRFFAIAGTYLIIYIYTLFPSRGTRYLRLLFQVALLNFWYPDTFEFNRIFPNLDHLFASAEVSLFGCQPSILFEQWLSGTFWRELFNFGYWMFYPMILAITTYFFFARPKEAERCAFIVLFSFFTYYIIFMFVPVAGPQFYFPVIGERVATAGPYLAVGDYFNGMQCVTAAQEGKGMLFTELVCTAQSIGERPAAAFPSSHAGVATVIMILASRRMKKWLFMLFFIVYLLLCLATVYIKAHYLIDAIAGIVSGILIFRLAAWGWGLTCND